MTIIERTSSYGVRVYRKGQPPEWVGSFKFAEYGGKREAKAAAKEAEELALKRYGKRLTVQALVDAYLDEYDGKLTSLATVTQRAEHLTKHLGTRWANDIGPLDAIEWKRKVPAYCIPAAIAVYNWGKEKWLVERNPFAKLAKATRGRSDDAPPTKDEFAKLLDACSVHGAYGPQMRALVDFAFAEGMRPGELFMLEWEQRIVSHKDITGPCSYIDLASQTVHVNWRVSQGDIDLPKSNKTRAIALTPPAAEALIGHPRRSNYVFVSKRGQRMSAATLSGYWNLVLAKADLDFDFYLATKHACVHYMWTELGVDEADIEEHMGWALGGAKELLKVYGHRDIGARERIQAAYKQNVVALREVSSA